MVDGYAVQECSPTKVWGQRRIVYNDRGQKVFTLLSEPRSAGFLRKDAGLLEVANEWLYHGLGLSGVLMLAERFQQMVFIGFSRLDLCCDFCPDEAQRAVIMGLADGSMYVVGKRNGSGFWSINTATYLHQSWLRKQIKHQQSWGHKTTAVKWKLYYKTKELYDAGGGKFPEKPYIFDCWRQAKFDLSNVWRLEVSIKHANEYMTAAGDFTVQNVLERMDDLMSDIYNSRFIVRRNQHHRDKSNDEYVPFLTPSQFVGGFRRQHPKSLAINDAHITLLRRLVQSCEEPTVYCDVVVRDATLSTISTIITADGLQRYFHRMMGKSYDAWEQDVRCRLAAMQHAGAAPAIRGSIGAKSADIKPNVEFEANERASVQPSEAWQAEERRLDERVKRLIESAEVS